MRMIAAACLVLSACITAPSVNAAFQASVAEWTRWEQALTSSKTYANPYADVTVSTTFTGPGGTVIRGYGFWDGGTTFRIRCLFTKAGTWTWTTSCSDTTNAGLHNRNGSVSVGAYGGPNPLYQRGYLKISADNRFLIHDDGTPFFWMADTSWVGLRAATQPEWESYIQKRRNQRFNVIQATSGNGFTNRLTDRDGHAPYTGSGSSLSWNPAYWQGVERKVQYANDQGLILYVAAVGSAFHGFPSTDPVHVRRFARNLVARLMGNFVIYSPVADEWWSSAADASGSEMQAASSMHLVSAHPEMIPATAATLYHDKPYTDFAGLQTSMGWLDQPHSASPDQWSDGKPTAFSGSLASRYAVEAPLALLHRAPLKPVINQEVVYDLQQLHGVLPSSFQQPYPLWLPRSTAYLTLLSGSKGVTYGCQGVWNWGIQGSAGIFGSGWDFNTALNQPSATEMQHLAGLFSGIAWWRLEPRHDLIRNQSSNWISRMVLARTTAGDLAVAYLPDNDAIDVDMSAFPAPMAARWFNPRSGGTLNISSGIVNSGIRSFARPAAGDWALVLTSGTTTPPPPPPPPSSGNLLVNPGFESGLLNWFSYGATGSSGDSGASTVASPARSGTRSLQIQASSAGYRTTVQEKPAQAGMSYQASAWISTGNLAGGAEVWLAWYNASKATLKWDKIGFAASTSPWVQVSGTKTAPSGTATVRLVLRTVAGSGTAWFDEATLTTGSTSSVVTGTGLTGQYFDNADFTMAKLTRTDATVDFVWGLGSPSSLVGADTFSVRWTGQIEAPATGTYTLTTVSDDGVRLWVNGQLLVNNWTIHAATENSGTISLSAGQKVAVRMEFYDNGGDATARLLWSGPGIARQIVPQSRLYPQ